MNKRNPSRTRRNLTLRGLLCPEPRLSKALTRCLRESRRQCPPEAGSFAKQGCGPGRVYPWSERDGEPWHSPGWLWVPRSAPPRALWSHPAPALWELQDAAALNRGAPRRTQVSTAQLRTWAPRTALQTRLCGLEIRFPSWSRDCFFSPAAGDDHPWEQQH